MTTPPNSCSPLRVLLVDDHPVIRDALRDRLKSLPRFTVAGEASNSNEALEQLQATRLDLGVIDIGLRKTNGLFLARQIRKSYPHMRTLIWSGHDRADYIREARAAGVCGYVLKDCPMSEVVRAIEVVADGGSYYSTGVEQVSTSRPELTLRESQILRLVASGETSSQIAKLLGIDCRTVETHRRSLLNKLDAKNTAEMIVIAVQLGLLE